MSLLLATLWPGLVGGFLLGIAVGALSGLPRTRLQRSTSTGLGLAAAALAILAMTGRVPGWAGFGVESGALILPAYLAGCLGGGIGRRVREGA